MKLLAWLLDLLFPRKCLLCDRLLAKEEQDLCAVCHTEAPIWESAPKSLPFLASWQALWYYEGNARESLLRYKFAACRCYAPGYGRLLAARLRERPVEFDILTWVPVSARRKRRRGYDQVALLAQAVGSELGIPPQATLVKKRHNPPQSTMATPAQRKANVLGAYEAVNPREFSGKRILLLDDILTTGATAGECARVLLTAGAEEVHCAALTAARRRS